MLLTSAYMWMLRKLAMADSLASKDPASLASLLTDLAKKWQNGDLPQLESTPPEEAVSVSPQVQAETNMAIRSIQIRQAGGTIVQGGRSPGGEVIKGFIHYSKPVHQAKARAAHENLKDLRYDEIKRLARKQGFSNIF
jgi:hypothetical protein